MAVETTTIPVPALETSRARTGGLIRQAAERTGASFDYLVAAAKIESNLNPSAAARTSSARGLFQFIEQTWLGTVKEAGASFGYGHYADAITRLPSGLYGVADPAMREAILKLRDDPAASAAMAGVLTQSNSFSLTGSLGRRPTDGELYIAHFLGVGGASRLISQAQDNPRVDATQLFPAAAAANRSIFYDRSGQPRSARDVYAVLTAKFDAAAQAPQTRAMVAAAGGGTAPAAAMGYADSATYLSAFPAATTDAAPSPASLRVTASAADNRPVFHSMFQGGDRAAPVTAAVRDLWTSPGAASPAQGASSQPELSRPMPLDLFSDRFGRFS